MQISCALAAWSAALRWCFSLFRYDSVFQPQSGVKAAVQEEIGSLKQVL